MTLFPQDVFDDETLSRILDVTSKLSKIAAFSPTIAAKPHDDESSATGGLQSDEAAPFQKTIDGSDAAQQTVTVSTSFAERVSSRGHHLSSVEIIKSDMMMMEPVKVVAVDEPEGLLAAALHHDQAAAELESPREVDLSEVPCSTGALDMSNSMDLRKSSSQLQSYLQLMRESLSAEEAGLGGSSAKGGSGDGVILAENKTDEASLADNNSSSGDRSSGGETEDVVDEEDEDEDSHSQELISTGLIGNNDDISGAYTASMRSRWRSWLRDSKGVGASQDLRSQQPKLRQFNHPQPSELQASEDSLPPPQHQLEEDGKSLTEGHSLGVLDPVQTAPEEKAGASGSSTDSSPTGAAQSDAMEKQNGAALAPVTPPRSPGPRGLDADMYTQPHQHHRHHHHHRHHQQQQHKAQPKPSEAMTKHDTSAVIAETPLDRIFGRIVLLVLCPPH